MNDTTENGNGLPHPSETNPAFAVDEVRRTLEIFLPPGQITEVRALGVTSPEGAEPRVYSGYFDSAEAICTALADLPAANGVYFSANPIKRELLWVANWLYPARSGCLTRDDKIQSRRFFMVDLDPVRASGISSTESELNRASERASEISTDLQSQGWPLPIRALSGNGIHLVYAVDLPADDGGLISRGLTALSARYSDAYVSVDTNVGNPARPLRLYGTWARKGENTLNRPHRLSRILTVPERMEAVPPLLLAQLAPETPRPEQRETHPSGQVTFDIDDWIVKHSLDVTGPKPWKGGRLWTFPVCPWNPEHADRSGCLIQLPNGALCAKCHHNGCSGKGWHELRDVVEPGWRQQEIWIPEGSPPAIANAYRRLALRRRGGKK